MVTVVLVLYLKWVWQHLGNKTEHEAHAEYDVTSSILGKVLVSIHCHVFAESLFWLTALCCHFSRKHLHFLISCHIFF